PVGPQHGGVELGHGAGADRARSRGPHSRTRPRHRRQPCRLRRTQCLGGGRCPHAGQRDHGGSDGNRCLSERSCSREAGVFCAARTTACHTGAGALRSGAEARRHTTPLSGPQTRWPRYSSAMLLATLLILAATAAIYGITQVGAAITLLFVIAVLVLAYKRLPLLAFSIVFTGLFFIYSWFGEPIGLWKGLLLLMLVVMWLFNVRPLRKALISRPFLKAYLRMLPNMSSTEREALEAGTVWWDGELFTGKPDWNKLLNTRPAQLSPEEQAFLDGPVEQLCAMVDDFDVTHRRADLPPEAWEFIKKYGFFAMIIPKQYGGLQLGTYAQSTVLIKLSSRSIVLGSTVAVPNSLGPGELLVHYGTPEQKDYYLPRLARGEEIPCFALTSPVAGSDAASITDTGIVCRGMYEGREVLGLKLNFSKRYITLAPIATVVGLAFRMFDPDHLVGDKEDIGITCALLPR